MKKKTYFKPVVDILYTTTEIDVALKLSVALPDHTAVLVCAVPDLAAEEFSAIAADQLCRKRAEAMWCLPLLLRTAISSCTFCHWSGSMIAGWLSSTMYCGTSPSFTFIFFVRKSTVNVF